MTTELYLVRTGARSTRQVALTESAALAAYGLRNYTDEIVVVEDHLTGDVLALTPGSGRHADFDAASVAVPSWDTLWTAIEKYAAETGAAR